MAFSFDAPDQATADDIAGYVQTDEFIANFTQNFQQLNPVDYRDIVVTSASLVVSINSFQVRYIFNCFGLS